MAKEDYLTRARRSETSPQPLPEWNRCPLPPFLTSIHACSSTTITANIGQPDHDVLLPAPAHMTFGACAALGPPSSLECTYPYGVLVLFAGLRRRGPEGRPAKLWVGRASVSTTTRSRSGEKGRNTQRQGSCRDRGGRQLTPRAFRFLEAVGGQHSAATRVGEQGSSFQVQQPNRHSAQPCRGKVHVCMRLATRLTTTGKHDHS